MRKILLLGLLLTGFIYALPGIAQRIDGAAADGATQDVLSVHAENPELSASGGQEVKISVQVDG